MRNLQIVFLSLALIFSACTEKQLDVAANSSTIENGETTTEAPVDPNPGGDPITPEPEENLGFCGPLDFTDVQWSSDFTTLQKKSLGLAMNITGSFEGRGGWSTIANNSDGQGLSLGLLQHNLGQDTLQPLMLQFLENNATSFQSFFSSSDFSSLEKMLLTWSGVNATRFIASDIQDDDELFPDTPVLSSLDIGYEKPELRTMSTASVNWAKNTLYTDGGTTFITRWKTSLKNMAQSSGYRSVQVESAHKYFTKAKNYFLNLQFTQMRSFLLMYDFVIQNGGFNSTHLSQYNSFLNSKPNATETEKANKLLEIRLTSVKSQYREDVRSRKSTIINTSGTVHGKRYSLATDFCFNPYEVLSENPPLP